MRRALAVEILKLRTVRYPWVVLVASELLVVAGISGVALSNDSLDGKIPTALAHTGLVAIASLVLGLFAVAGEFRHGTITDTYLSDPGRTRSLAAKAVVTALAGLGIGLAAAVSSVVATFAWWQAKGETFSLTAEGWQTLAGGIARNVSYAAIGVAVGALVRSLVGAVALALGWIVVIENIVTQLVGDSAGRWLPFSAGNALARMNLGGTADQLSQSAAGAILVGYLAALGFAAALMTLSRDVA